MGRLRDIQEDKAGVKFDLDDMAQFTSAVLEPPNLDDLEDLLSQLNEDEVHLPASVRNSYRCNKASTGELNRDSLIKHINDEGLNAKPQEEIVPFELGKKRGKIYIPTYNEAEQAAMARAAEVADAVRLDDDEEAALGDATTNDLMSLAEILDSNPQEFIMEAYADPLNLKLPLPSKWMNPFKK